MTSPMNGSRPQRSRAGPPASVPDLRARRTVSVMAAFGIPKRQIARAHGLTLAELHQDFQDELTNGRTRADAKIVETLYNLAIGGNVTALTWWTKARMGWKETLDNRHSGEGGEPLFPEAKMSDRDIARRIALIFYRAERST